MDFFERDADTEGVQLFDNRLDACNTLLSEVLEFHVQGEVRRVAEVTQNVDVLSLPHGGNFDTRNDFEPDFLGRFFGNLETIEVVVVRNGYAAESLALAEREQFINGERPIRKLGVQMQIRIAAIFVDDC